MPDILRRIEFFILVAHLAPEGSPGHHPGHHFHHQRQPGSLGSAQRQDQAFITGLCVGRWAAVLVQRPAFGDRLARRRSAPYLAARHHRCGHIQNDRRIARRSERERARSQKQLAPTPHRHGRRCVGEHQRGISRFNRLQQVARCHAEMVGVLDPHHADPEFLGPLGRHLHGFGRGEKPEPVAPVEERRDGAGFADTEFRHPLHHAAP